MLKILFQNKSLLGGKLYSQILILKSMRPFGARSPSQQTPSKREDKQPLIKPVNIRPSLEENKFLVLAALNPKPGLTITHFPPLPSPALSSIVVGKRPTIYKKHFSQASSGRQNPWANTN